MRRSVILPVRKSAETDVNIPRARILKPVKVDFELIRSCVEGCERAHIELGAGQSSHSAGLRVIDCHEMVIIESPPNCQYIALSYVWGTSAVPDMGIFQPNTLPQVVIDAIACTLELGYRYLWVDRYCVPQNNTFLKHQQPRNMHLIYKHAWITIIAVCSPDASVGLSGMGGTPRRVMPSAKIGSSKICRCSYRHTRSCTSIALESSGMDFLGRLSCKSSVNIHGYWGLFSVQCL
jgi:hypothetical protein